MMTYQYENKFCSLLGDSSSNTDSNFVHMLLQKFPQILIGHIDVFLNKVQEYTT